MRLPSRNRRGALMVEAAFVFPVVAMLLIFIVVGGIGVFRFQQVACLAREAARYASVRGGDYQRSNETDSPSTDDILQAAVLPCAMGLSTQDLTITVYLIEQASKTAVDWNASSRDVKSISSAGEYVTNSVRVTISYTWNPGLFVGAKTLQSTCEMPMSF